jgi:hypothetical protein
MAKGDGWLALAAVSTVAVGAIVLDKLERRAICREAPGSCEAERQLKKAKRLAKKLKKIQ